MAEPTAVPTPDLTSYQAAYGPLAFGLVTTVIILIVVWWLLIKPLQEQVKRAEDARDKHLDQMERIGNTNLELSRTLAAAGVAFTNATNDMRQIAHNLERSLSRSERREERTAG